MSTDQEIFDSAVSATPEQTENAPEAPVEAPVEGQSDRARDDKGRFVPKAPEAPETVAQETAPEPTVETEPKEPESDARVPSWRLAEEAERRRESDRQSAELRNELRQMQMQMAQLSQQRQQPQAQQDQIDPFADPTGFANNIQQGFEQKLQQLQLQHSLQFARFAHKDVFDKAYESFVDYAHRTRDQATYQRIMSDSDPGEALVKWHKEQELHKELGGTDLKSFLAKQREEWMKDPATQAQVIEAFKATQQAQPSAVTNLPPSLSRVASAAPSHDADDGDDSGAAMWRYATAKR